MPSTGSVRLSVPAEGGSIYGPRAKPDYAIDPDNGCWVWAKGLTRQGYPNSYAHRRYYERAHGDIPAGFHVHHVCHNKACVNPEHLEAVAPRAHISTHTAERTNYLRDRDVQEIREWAKDPSVTYRAIQERYGIGERLVVIILNGQRSYTELGPVQMETRCEWCGDPMPAGKRRHARFCCKDHQAKFNGRKQNKVRTERRRAQKAKDAAA